MEMLKDGTYLNQLKALKGCKNMRAEMQENV